MPAPTFSAIRRTAAGGAVAIFAFALAASTALAQTVDADDFADKLQAALGGAMDGLDFSEAVGEGDSVLLRDVTLTGDEGERFELGTLTFEGVRPDGSGGYTAREMLVPDIDRTDEDTRVRITGITASGIEIPAGGDGFVENTFFYQQARTGQMTVSVEGDTVFELSELVVDVARRVDGSGFDSMVRAEDMRLDLSVVEDDAVRQALRDFDYEQLTGRIQIAAGWTPESGEVDLSDYTIALDDVGTLTLAFRFTGYTEEVVEAIQQAQAQALTAPNPQAANIAMFGILQQLDFESARIRFEDDGVTEKALDYSGRQQGIDSPQMAAALKGMLPLFLGQLQNPAFQEQVSAAVNAYLDNPQTLTITARPENAVSFATVMGAGMSAPQTLPDVLNITITAND